MVATVVRTYPGLLGSPTVLVGVLAVLGAGYVTLRLRTGQFLLTGRWLREIGEVGRIGSPGSVVPSPTTTARLSANRNVATEQARRRDLSLIHISEPTRPY